jgi:hypothetical protein
MIKIVYDASGEVVSDWEIYHFLRDIKADIKDGIENEYIIANGTAIHAVLTEIAEGNLNAHDIVFDFWSKVFGPGEHGEVSDWPSGWCDLEARLAERRLIAQHKNIGK